MAKGKVPPTTPTPGKPLPTLPAAPQTNYGPRKRQGKR